MAALSAAVVLAVPIAADRTAAALAERRLATRLSCAAGLTGLHVSVGGFPFLTQLARGTFADVRLRADAATFRGLTLTDVEITATGVRGTGADSLTAAAVIDYSVLTSAIAGKAAGLDLATAQFGGDDAGRLVISTSVPLRGLTMAAIVYADLALSGTTLTITPGEIELADLGLRLPADRLPGDLAGPRTVTLPALPADVTYQRITATPGGLSLAVSATNPTVSMNSTNTRSCEGTE